MAASLKKNFAAKALRFGAKHDLGMLCRIAFGHADGRVNSEAMRIAAENKSYAAVTSMVDQHGRLAVPNSPFDFSHGDNWSRVREIAGQDPRLDKILQNGL